MVRLGSARADGSARSRPTRTTRRLLPLVEWSAPESDVLSADGGSIRRTQRAVTRRFAATSVAEGVGDGRHDGAVRGRCRTSALTSESDSASADDDAKPPPWVPARPRRWCLVTRRPRTPSLRSTGTSCSQRGTRPWPCHAPACGGKSVDCRGLRRFQRRHPRRH